MLLGVETCYQAQYLPPEGKVWTRTVYSLGDGRMLLAMQSLIIITRAFLQGARMPGDLELAEQLGCSTVVLKPALDALEGACIISRGDSREKPCTLMRAPDRIPLAEIRQALFKGGAAMRFPEEMTRLFSSFRRGADEGVTLAEIAAGSGPADGGGPA